jgi:subtilase family serine protease
VNLGGNQTNDGWASEEMLDVEWAHGIAPGAKILVVEAQSQNQTDLIAAVNVAKSTPGVATVSMSWGFSEFAGETQYDSVFTSPPGHQGVTFFAASGDSGSSSGAEWPAASPNVVAVGGTTLALTSSNTIAGESAWTESGGGYSQYESEPSYQLAVQNTGARSTPDVAFDADPTSGAEVYYTTPSNGRGTWQSIGGTSLGTPAWAAIVAIVDQGLSIAGKNSLDGATQTLPAMYQIAAANGGDFNFVAPTTTTTHHGGFGGGWLFGGGWFAASSTTVTTPLISTALGSPNGPKLVADLVATPLASTTTPSGSTKGTTTAHPAKHPKKKVVHPVKKKKVVVNTHKAHKTVAHDVIDAAIEAIG